MQGPEWSMDLLGLSIGDQRRLSEENYEHEDRN